MMTMVNSSSTSSVLFNEDFMDELLDILLAAYDGDLPVEGNAFDAEDVAAAASLGFITTQLMNDVFCGEWSLTVTGRDFLIATGEINEDDDDEEEI